MDWVVDSFLDLVVDLFVDSGFEIRGGLVLQLRLLFVLIYIFCQHYALVSQMSIVSIETILGRVLKRERKKH